MVTYSNLMFFQLSILCTEWFLADHTDFFLHSHFRVWKSENKIQLISLEIECCLMFNLPQLLSAQFWKKMYMHLFAHLYTLACHFAFSSNLETDVTCLIDWADLVGELEKTNFGIFKLFRDDICIIVSPSPPHWAWETLPQCKGVRLVSKVFPALLRVPNFLVFAKASEAGNLTSVAIDPVTPLGWSINHILGYLAEFYLYSTVIPLTPLDLLDLLYYLFSTEDALILTIHPHIALPLTFFFFNFFA